MEQIRQNIYVDNSHMQQRTLGASVKAKISEPYPVLDLLQRTLRFVKISQSHKKNKISRFFFKISLVMCFVSRPLLSDLTLF